MMKEDRSKLIEVFKGTPWEADLLKSMIESNGIRAAVKDAMVVNIVLPATAIEVAVLVNETDFEEAMQVVREYLNNKQATDN
ncbi:MAG: DUF2007 domain-containing protein [Bacteroides sp.]|nr:DUF2007 domain-containing protein [Bacteroides sp.]